MLTLLSRLKNICTFRQSADSHFCEHFCGGVVLMESTGGNETVSSTSFLMVPTMGSLFDLENVLTMSRFFWEEEGSQQRSATPPR